MKHFRRYAGAYVRGFLYAMIAFLTAYCAEFEPLKEKTSDQINALTWIFWSWTWAKILGSTAVTMRAFFDGTVERAGAAPEVPAAAPKPAPAPALAPTPVPVPPPLVAPAIL